MKRPRSTRALPERYAEADTFDIKEKKGLILWLNVLGGVGIFVFGALFLLILRLVRPAAVMGEATFSLTGTTVWIGLLHVLIVTAVMLVLHEAAHGLAFRLINGEWGTFAFKGVYAYAAAPDWYMLRNQHLIAALVPFLGLSLLGVLLMAVVPPGWLPDLLLFLILNASGAVGDLAMAVWLLGKPSEAYVRDYGDGLTVYLPIDGGS